MSQTSCGRGFVAITGRNVTTSKATVYIKYENSGIKKVEIAKQ